MLNFQIRGYGINICAGTIDNDRVQGLLDTMRDNKSSLAQVMYDDNWREFSNIIESRSPFITDDGELIITSYNSKDYYDDGHSFFRSNIKDLAIYLNIEEFEIDGFLHANDLAYSSKPEEEIKTRKIRGWNGKITHTF